MTRSQVITKLKHEGYAATVGRVRQALLNGHVCPPPAKAARGAYDFTHQHLAQLRWYFVYIRPGPRPCQAEDLPVDGSEDRMHRLARKKQLRQEAATVRALSQPRTIAFDAAIKQFSLPSCGGR